MRRWLLLIGFGTTFALVAWGVRTAANTAVPLPADIGLSGFMKMAPVLQRLAESPPSSNEKRVVFLGDSTSKSVATRLDQELDRREEHGNHFEVYRLTYAAMQPYDYYFISDPVGRAAPDHVVMAVNFRAFSGVWKIAFRRQALAAWIPPRRWLEAATLPLHRMGITFDRFLLDSTLVNLGATRFWFDSQLEASQGAQAYERFETAIEKRGGTGRGLRGKGAVRASGSDDAPPRLTPIGVRAYYGSALQGIDPDDPVLRMLDAAIRSYVSAGAVVTLYVVPANVEHFAAAGYDDQAGLDLTVQRIRNVADAGGARVIDLHAMLPDAAFQDYWGHFRDGSKYRGATRVAEALADAMLAGPELH